MKIHYRLILATISVIAIVLELLPCGAVLVFAPNPVDQIIRTYAYFSMYPFCYGNFGPLLTAIFTCVIFALGVIYLFINKKQVKKVITALSAVALLTSVWSILDYATPVGVFISILLFSELLLSLRKHV